MKKKIFALVITIFLIIPCFMINASAIIKERDDNSKTYGIVLSDDYKTLYYKGVNYERIDASMTMWNYSTSFLDVKYDSDKVKSVDFELSEKDVIISANILLYDGSIISSTYIKADKHLDEHNMLSKYASKYTVDFGFPYDNQVELNSNQISKEKSLLSQYDLDFYEYFDVNVYSSDNTFYINLGCLLVIDDAYYYVDYVENGIIDFFDLYGQVNGSVQAYKIIDPIVIEKLDEAYDEYNSDTIGFITGEISEIIGVVLIILVFGLLPLAVLVVFLILFLKAKSSNYKKIFRTIWIISAAEITLFLMSVVILVL